AERAALLQRRRVHEGRRPAPQPPRRQPIPRRPPQVGRQAEEGEKGDGGVWTWGRGDVGTWGRGERGRPASSVEVRRSVLRRPGAGRSMRWYAKGWRYRSGKGRQHRQGEHGGAKEGDEELQISQAPQPAARRRREAPEEAARQGSQEERRAPLPGRAQE